MTASTPAPSDDPVLLLQAYLDDELDPINALAIEQRLASDPALAAKRDRIIALRNLMRDLPREAPSATLRRRIETSLRLRRGTPRPSWLALAASVALMAFVSSSSTWYLAGYQPSRATEDTIVADHVRALMAPQPVDVVSTERHTVKPWFNGRVPEAPRVVDLTGAGFPLAGGRIDVVGRSPVPTLVYHRRKHVISVTAVRTPDTPNAEPSFHTNNGYNIGRWVAGGVEYWAISDVAPTDLREFVELFRSAPS